MINIIKNVDFVCGARLYSSDTQTILISETNVEIIVRKCFCLFDLFLYVPSTIFQLNRDGSPWVEPVIS